MVNSPIEPAAESGVPDFLLKEDASRRVSTTIVLVFALLLACASVVLCALWGSYDGPGFIGQPDLAFESNLVSWHTILLVCGFFFAQVMALTVTGIFPASRHPQLKGKVFIYHLCWMLIAAAALVAGNKAAFDYYDNVRLPNIQSVHAWYGVATAVVYAVNLILVLISSCVEEDREWYSFKAMRLVARITAFLLTVVSVASGIMLFQGETGCFPRTIPLPLPAPDYNPAARYPDMPVGCRISNGLGVAVAASALCTVYFLALRYDGWQDQTGRRLFLAGMEAARASMYVGTVAVAEAGSGSGSATSKEWKDKVAGLYRTAQRGGWEVRGGGRQKGNEELKEGVGEGNNTQVETGRGGTRVAQASGGGILI